jgi:MFS family permease
MLPAIPQIASDIGTTPAVINYTVAGFVLIMGIAPLFWSPFASFYGRRALYLASMPIGMVASVGVGLSRNVPDLVVTRILQAIGGLGSRALYRDIFSYVPRSGTSCVVAVGAGTVGDIYK